MYPFTHYGTLHVLPGCKAAYEVEDIWKNFTIVEDAGTEPDISGIENVHADGVKENNAIHTLSGIRKGNDVMNLTPGLYIKNDKKVVIK